MSKQTAVEWLIEQCPRIETIVAYNILEQAKSMEKEQIQAAYKDGLIWHPNDFLDQKQYYDEIYGGDK